MCTKITINFIVLFLLQDAGLYLKSLIPPVLTCFYDQDSRVRYYACEALYNIAKVARGSVLPFFNNVFDGLSKVRENFLYCLVLILLLYYNKMCHFWVTLDLKDISVLYVQLFKM